jgi:anaerobic selenocysteine-containing dehydrogenase
VRLLDALSMVSGNLDRPGGGVSFYFRRRGAFATELLDGPPPPRTLCEPLLGRELLEARDPPVRALWVTAGNPVAMLPDSATVARAIEGLEFSVVVDAFPTDTTRRATLVLPTTTLLEDDDLLGAYGHHLLAVSRPVVPPPPGVLTDLELVQALARRLGLEHAVAGTAREWKARLLSRVADRGASLEDLERGAVQSPVARPVLFADLAFETPSGRMNLVGALPPPADAPEGYPLWLFSNSTDRAQASQWARPLEGPLPATVHPEAAGGLADGARARLVSPLGAIEVALVHDPAQRRDVVLVPKGGSFDRGQSANALVPARVTDAGEGAAYLDARVRLEPVDPSAAP